MTPAGPAPTTQTSHVVGDAAAVPFVSAMQVAVMAKGDGKREGNGGCVVIG